MVKHGNPVSGTEGFPIGKHGRTLFARANHHPDLLMAYLFCAATACGGIARATVPCVETDGVSVSSLLSAVRSLSKRIDKHMEARMIEILTDSGAAEA
jgi:hypothetical protein